MESKKVIDKRFEAIADVIESNELLKEWFIRNQEDLIKNNLVERDSKYEGPEEKYKVLAIMARALFSWANASDDKYPKDLRAKSAALAIAQYSRDYQKTLSKQQSLVYIEKTR